MKKKTILWSILTAVLFLVSCEPKAVVKPTEMPKQSTPTVLPVSPTEEPIAELTATPMATCPAESPKPTVLVTETPEPTATVVPTVTEAVLPTPVSTSVPEPTEVQKQPDPTIQPISPTEVPEATPTVTPVPMVTLTPTVTPAPTATPTPTVTPTPTINPEPLVTNGWQKAVSMDEKYAIIFPELFRDSYVVKTDRELFVGYTDTEDTAVLFAVCYKMEQNLEEAVEEILLAGGKILEKWEEERRVQYQYQTDGIVYCGILLQNQYSGALLGNAFGETDAVTGVMEVLFSYPADRAEAYETENYSFYVVKNGEE